MNPNLPDDEFMKQPTPSAEAVRLTDWENEPSVLDVRTDLEAAKPAHDTQMQKITKWNDLMYVRGAAKPKTAKGRSAVQPKLIRKQAEWRYAALSEPFLSTDKLFVTKPATFEDKNAAVQNELVLNHQFRNRINRIKFVDDVVRSTVDDGTCIIRIGWKRTTTRIQENAPVWAHIPIETQEDLTAFQEALQARLDNPREFNEKAPAEIKAALEYYDESQQATIAQQIGTEKVWNDKILENAPTAEVMDPNNVFIDPSCNGDLKKALFVVVSFETNMAELMKNPERYKNLDRVNWDANTPVTNPDHETTTPTDFQFKDTARKKVVAYEYWGYYDIHKTGQLVPIVCTWIGDTMVRMEENPFPNQSLPFVLIPYLPVKRDMYGETDAELLEDNQKILGAVTRGMIDLLGRSANAQQGFAKGMLDPLNRRRYENGQDYEYNPNINPAAGLIEHKYPEIPQSALLMLNLQNQEAEALTGVKSFSGGLSGEAYGDVAAGIRGVLDAASKREMSILRRIAKGITEVGEHFVSMNAEFLSEKEVVRITNETFVEVYREDLPGNFDLIVDISTAEVDNAKANDLAFMLQTLGPKADIGLSMMILAEIARLKRMPDLAERLEKFRPQPSPEQQELAQLEIERARKEIAKLDSEIQLNQAKAQELANNAAQKQLDIAEQASGTKHARDMQKQQAQAQGNQNLEVTKALVKPTKEGESSPDIAAAIGFNQLLNKDGQSVM